MSTIQTQKAAELIGYFVEVDVWSKLILKSVRTGQSFTSIMVLAAVIRGTEASKLKPYLDTILDTLYTPDVCQSVTVSWQHPLELFCVHCANFLCPRHSKNGGGALSVTPVCVRPSVIKIWCPLNNF